MHHKNQKLYKDVKTIYKPLNICLNFNEESDTSAKANDIACIDSDEDFGLEKFSNKEVQKYGINNFVLI